jgi:hypothetical protein
VAPVNLCDKLYLTPKLRRLSFCVVIAPAVQVTRLMGEIVMEHRIINPGAV